MRKKRHWRTRKTDWLSYWMGVGTAERILNVRRHSDHKQLSDLAGECLPNASCSVRFSTRYLLDYTLAETGFWFGW